MSRELVTYKTVEGKALTLLPAFPDPAHFPGPRPAAVLFHAGGWRKGSPAKMARMAQAFAAHGVAALAVEYRLIEEETLRIPREGIEDARSAMRHIRAHAAEYGIRPDRLLAVGGSAGGHLAMMTALRSPFDDSTDDLSVSPAPQALVTLSSPYNFDKYKSDVPLEARRRVAPFHLVDSSFPPILMLHGSQDTGIPLIQAERFRDKALEAGAPDVTLVAFEGRGHSFYSPQRDDGADFQRCMSLIESFLGRLGWLHSQ